MTTIEGISVGDIVSLKGEDGEWLVESFPPTYTGHDVCFYPQDGGDNYIQMEVSAGIQKIDKVLRKRG